MNPITVFPNNKKAAWFWFAVSGFLLTAFICQGYFLSLVHATRERMIIMDSAGTFHIAPVEGMEKAEKMQEYIVRLATIAFLSRNPGGLDHKILFRQIFSEKVHSKANKIMDIDRSLFDKKEIYQKVVIPKINIQKTTDNEIIALSAGQLIRTWNFHGDNETEILWFKMKFKLVRNENLIRNGRLPLVVANFKLKTYRKDPCRL
jgi:hypothetical protein